MSTDLPDYHLPRVVQIDHVELIDLISEITLIKTIANILNIDNISSVDVIDTISTIDNITEIAHITGLDIVLGVGDLFDVYDIHTLRHLAHANTTENLVKNATITSLWDNDAGTYIIKDWILSRCEVADTIGGVEGEGWVDILANGYIKQYLKPIYGDETAFLIWIWSQHTGVAMRVTFTFTDDTTEVFNFTTTAGTKTTHLCESTTHKRLKSVTIANLDAIYSFYVDEVNGAPAHDPSEIRDLTSTDVVSVEQSDETKLKATVTQAEKDREISDITKTATEKQISNAFGEAGEYTVWTPAAGKKVRIKLICLELSAAVNLSYRWGTGGTDYYLRTTAGPLVINLVGANIEGAANTAWILYASGACTVKGFILGEEVD